MNLNKTQLEAIGIRGQNVVVFASAGAGKTTVLVQRLTERIIIDKIPLTRILAMTFTEAAAGNMKNRLRNELNQKRQEALNKGTNEELSFIDDQLSNLENADISTIHSFCLKIVRKYYYRCGLTQNTLNNILSSAQSDMIKDDLLNEIIEEEIKKDQGRFIELTDAISSEIFAFDSLKKTILSIFESALNKKDPLVWLNDQKGHKRISSLNDLKACDDLYLNKVKRIFKKIRNAYMILSTFNNTDVSDAYRDECRAIVNRFDELLAIDNYEEFIAEAKRAPIAFNKRSKCEDPAFKKINKRISELYKKLSEILIDPEIMIDVENGSIRYIDHLIDLTITFYERFKTYKLQNEWIDFSDFEHYAYEILTIDDRKIAKELKEHYREIMIDEFQDTNEIQFAIAELLGNDDLFIVGDIKQSIYRFRSAKPDLMRSLRQRDDFKVIDMRENYRSKANIVAFNNKFFAELMNIDDTGFKDEDKQITPQVSQTKDEEPIEFIYYEPTDDFKELNSKADLLAEEILSVHEKGTAFGKMCVLVRTNADKIKVKRAFDNADIPYFISDKEGHLASFPIDIVASILDYLVDHEDKIAIVSILMSLYDYHEDDIAKSRHDLRLDERAAYDLRKLEEAADQNDIDGFFSYLLNINDFYERLSTNEKANIDYLISSIDNYKLKSFKDLAFILSSMQDKESDTAFAVSDEADVVKVMTIHAAKGLEYDTVFLFSTHEVRTKDATDAVVIDDELGIGLKYAVNDYRLTYETYRRKAIRIKNDREEMREYLRLLYVALTRTVRKLIVIDAFDRGGFSKLREIGKEELIEEHKGFSSYFLTLSFPEDMNFTHIDKLSHPSYKKERAIPSVIRRQYNSSIRPKKKITPSDHGQKIVLFDDNKGTSFGTSVHKIMELIDLKEIDEERIRMIDDTISDKTIKHILKIKDDSIFKKALEGKIYREVPFYADLESEIEGIIDFVSVFEDKVIIIDYKTDSVDHKDLLIDRYRDQIMIYHDILKRVYLRDVEAYIYSFHLDMMIRVV